ncbi:hypothetical protein ABR738_14735 [Streptomyces sp. Edi4]
MGTYESHDLDAMTPTAALNAVIADVRSHPVSAGPTAARGETASRRAR